MAIVVAPTTGYNSYVSFAAAEAFHEARATPEWLAAEDEAKEAALIRATDYVDATYTFIVETAINGVVNPLIVKAVCVLAVAALTDTLAGAREEQQITYTRQKLDNVGEKEVHYSGGHDPHPMVTKILQPIARTGSGGVTTGVMIR